MDLKPNLELELIDQLWQCSDVTQLLIMSESTSTGDLVFSHWVRTMDAYNHEGPILLGDDTFGLKMG